MPTKHLNKYTQLITFTLLLLFVLTGCKRQSNEIVNKLDEAIKNKKVYEDKKREKINSLRNLLDVHDLNTEQEYEINRRFYEAYQKYRLDSAIHYQKRNLELAAQMNDTYKMTETRLQLVPLHSFMGQFVESEQLLKSIDRNTLPEKLLTLYYQVHSQFYYHYYSVTHLDEYSKLNRQYTDSILINGDKESFIYQSSIIYRHITEKKFKEAEELINKLVEECEKESARHAEIAYSYAVLLRRKGDKEASKKYFCEAAIYDIKNAVKENASFSILAQISKDEGDIDRAITYSQLAIEDAMFSNIQSRAAQIYGFYSIINTSYKHKIENSNDKLQKALIFISLSSILLIFMLIYSYKQMKRLTRLKEHISKVNKQLTSLNDDLHEKNKQMSILNNVKEQYIAQFLELCSGYINKMDEYRQSLNKLVLNKQIDELRKKLKSTSIIDAELDLLYKSFDSIFLTLYPTFVEDFNKLLVHEEQIQLKNNGTLNLELRIFALLRLGIKNSASIASFLHCSISTIYNYRTKMRNKAICPRDDFESEIMKIGI